MTIRSRRGGGVHVVHGIHHLVTVTALDEFSGDQFNKATLVGGLVVGLDTGGSRRTLKLYQRVHHFGTSHRAASFVRHVQRHSISHWDCVAVNHDGSAGNRLGSDSHRGALEFLG